MWQANKLGIICLLIGLALLGGAYCYLRTGDERMAEQVLACGFCLLLFIVGGATWVTARRDLKRIRERDDT